MSEAYHATEMHRIFVGDYAYAVRSNGALSMTNRKTGAVVIDRGLIHEVIDRDHWQRDPATSVAERLAADDSYKLTWHYLQHRGRTLVSAAKIAPGCVVFSQPGSATTQLGPMVSVTRIEPFGRGVAMRTMRVFTDSIGRAGDASLCFLTPRGFAKRYAAEALAYRTRAGSDPWEESDVDGVIETAAGVRIAALVGSRGWGAILGDGDGFCALFCKIASRRGGQAEIRVTCPRASGAFDEVEMQWQNNGPRSAGEIEQASIYLFPISSVDDAVKECEATSCEF